MINVPSKHSDNGYNYLLEEVPKTCPYCYLRIVPSVLFVYSKSKHSKIEVLFACTNSECQKSFIGYYNKRYEYHYLKGVSKGDHQKKEFPEDITRISPSFVEIYNESLFALNSGLKQIPGAGFRKALEFLIKDYCTLRHPKAKEVIENATLMQVIKTYVADSKIKDISERASWLGNDEVHYIKRWIDKDVQDLIMLIGSVVYWIEQECIYSKLDQTMPKKKKQHES